MPLPAGSAAFYYLRVKILLPRSPPLTSETRMSLFFSLRQGMYRLCLGVSRFYGHPSSFPLRTTLPTPVVYFFGDRPPLKREFSQFD